MKKLRIFHGLNNITGAAAALARAERELGVDSHCVGFLSKFDRLNPDLFLMPTNYPPFNYASFKEYADQFDVFVFYFGTSFAGQSLADIPILKKMGKKVVFYFRGCDIRQSKLAAEQINTCICSECWPQKCNKNRKHAKETAEKYADAIWVSTADLLHDVDGARLMPQSVNLENLCYNELLFPNDKIKIVHSPSSPQRKGTKYILQAIKELEKKIPIDLILLSGLSWQEAHDKKIEAHFAIDQLLVGWYGVASVESMALGKPTVCFIHEPYLQKSGLNPSVINANPTNIKDVIYKMCTDKDSYLQTIRSGRAYVENVHDVRVVAKKTIKIYESFF